jgi:hypothetical protein
MEYLSLTKITASHNEFIIILSNRRSRKMSLGLATKLLAGVRFQQVQEIFLFYIASRLTLNSNQPPIQWISGAASSRTKGQRGELDHLHLVLRSRMVRLHLHSTLWLHGTVLKYMIQYGDNFTLCLPAFKHEDMASIAQVSNNVKGKFCHIPSKSSSTHKLAGKR